MKVSSELALRYQPWSKHLRVWTGGNEASAGESDPHRLNFEWEASFSNGVITRIDHLPRELVVMNETTHTDVEPGSPLGKGSLSRTPLDKVVVAIHGIGSQLR